MVYDSVTKRPLDPAYVIIRKNGEDTGTAITDLELPKGNKVKMSFEKEGKKTEVDFEANSFVGKAVIFEKTLNRIRVY